MSDDVTCLGFTNRLNVLPVEVRPGVRFLRFASRFRTAVVFSLGSERVIMSCSSCGSETQKEFASEISVHLLGMQNVNKPTVMVFPKLLVCLKCGFTGFKMAESELRLLEKS